MVQPLDGGNQAISNVASLVINSSEVPSGALALIVGGNIVCEELSVNGGSISCDNQPLTLTGTANAPMGFPNPTVLVGGGSVLQADTGLVVGFDVIPGQTKVAQFAGDVEITNNGLLNVIEVAFDTKTAITSSSTTPDTLELVATAGATVVVSNKTNTGQVYDTFFNKPGQINTLSSSLTVGSIATGTYGPFSFTPTRTGLYAIQFGYETGSGATGIPPGCKIVMYDSDLPSTAVITVKGYMNTGAVADTTVGFSMVSDTVVLTAGTAYDFRYDVSGGPIVVSTNNSGQLFFNVAQYC
jgi:hypothetical protein